MIAARGMPQHPDIAGRHGDLTEQPSIRTGVVLGLFFASGISALIYEITWTRMLTLLLGDTIWAVSTVLAAFMAGLAVGGLWGGRLSDRRAPLLTVYAVLEICTGLIACLLPLLLQAIMPGYIWLHRRLDPNLSLLTALRSLSAFTLLVIPTSLMGATLPVLSRYVVRTHATLGQRLGMLYGLNAGGAVGGCLLAGFVLIGGIGVYETVAIGAGLNLAIGMLAWRVNQHAKLPYPIPDAAIDIGPRPDAATGADPALLRLVLWGYALAGFAGLSYEVIWTRALIFFVGNSTYAFSAMLTTYLCGLALGSLVLGRLSDRTSTPLLWLGGLQLGVGIYGLLTIPILGKLFYGLDTWWSGFTSADWGTPLWLKFAKTFIVIFPATFCMGATFPLASKIAAAQRQTLGQVIGKLYALNTVGAIAGSWVAGFAFIPFLGMQKSLQATALINLVVGGVFLAHGRDQRRLWQGAVCVGMLILLLGVNFGVPTLRFADIAGEPEQEILYYDEGSTAVVKVATDVHERRILSINGWSVAGTGSSNPDLDLVNDYPEVQKILAHLPLLLHAGARRALIIGFGAGGTAWSMSRYDLERLDIVEFIPGVITAARFFPEVNHQVLTDPRVRVTIDDGRNYLLVTPETYDVVSVDTLDPKHAGNGNLYTEEFYQLSKRVLNPGGIFVQWLPYHQVDPESLKLIVRTFQHVYPDATLWLTRFKGYTLLVGTLAPLRIDVGRLEARFRDPVIGGDLAEAHVSTPWQFLEGFTMAPVTLRRYSAGVQGLNSYDHPMVEFFGFSWQDPIATNLTELGRYGDDVVPLLAFDDSYPPSRQAAIREHMSRQRRVARHIFRGYLANWRGHLQEGTREYRKALRLDPSDEGVKHALGISPQQRQQALAALQSNPHNVKALGKLGYIAWNAQRYSDAIQYFQLAIALDPEHAAAYQIHLGVNYAAQGHYDASLAAYGEAARLHPEHASLVAQSVELVRPLQRAAAASDDAALQSELGRLYAADGRFDRAIEVLEKAVTLVPEEWQTWLQLATAYEAEERWAEALEAYRRVLTLQPGHALASNNYNKLIIKAALDSGMPTTLSLADQSMIELDSESADSYYQLGLRYLHNGETEAAIAALQRAVSLQATHAPAYLFLGIAQTESGAYAEAIASYQRAIALTPHNAEAFNYLGLVYQQQGRLRQAVRAYRRAISLAPDYAMAYANLAASYEAMGQEQQALLAYRSAWERNLDLAFVREKIVALEHKRGR